MGSFMQLKKESISQYYLFTTFYADPFNAQNKETRTEKNALSDPTFTVK